MTVAPASNSTAPAALDSRLPDEFSRLRHMIPLRRLSDSEFVDVMSGAELELLDANEVLFQSGIDDGSMFYLLEGSIRIEDDGGEHFVLIGGSIETAHPLSPHPQARRLATTETDVVYVRLPLELLQLESTGESRFNHRDEPGFEVEELEENDSGADKRIIFEVYHALMDGSFTLPTLPDIAFQIRTAAADPDRGVDELTRIVQSDPAIAAYCIRVANSAAYAGASRVIGVRDAIVRIGATATAEMITAYTLRELYTAPDERSKALMKTAWRHSARIAALSFIIAERSQTLNPEQALLGGLMHDIGMLIIINEWHAHGGGQLTAASIKTLGRELSGSLGSMVLRNWQMPDSIVISALESERWTRNSGIALDVCDCITLAHAHDTERPPWSSKAPPIEQLGAYAKLPNGRLDEASRLEIVSSAESELRELDQILKG